MRKLVVLLGVLALVIGTGGVAKLHASDITIYDNAIGPNPWWNRGTANNSSSEDQETEYNAAGYSQQGTQIGQQWDLEAFRQNKNLLSIIGGFNFPTGKTDGYIEPLGALFLKTVSAPPYGLNNFAGNDVNPGIVSNSFWDYDYAITFAFKFDAKGNSTGGTYTVYQAGANPTVILHNQTGGTVGDVSNPLTISDGWDFLQTGTFTYITGLKDSDPLLDGNLLGDENNVGSHNVISGIDLSFLKDPKYGGNPDTYLHLTYGCGNDNLMGEIPAGTVPVPPSVLLLGTGLLGLVGLRRFRKN